MTLPWEPPPHPQQQPPVFNTRNSNTTDNNTHRASTSTSNSNSSTLGDFDVLFSFLHLERTSLATPSTAASVSTTASAAPPSPPAGIPSNLIAPTWGNHSKDDTLAPPSPTYTSQLGNLSMVMRYLQAHKTYPSSSSPPTQPPLAQTIQTPDREREPAETNKNEDECGDLLGTSRRRLKKKATRKLPIDEPSSSSCGGWVSSESDHKEEEVMGRSPPEAEEPDLVVVHEATNIPQPPPNNTIATITDFLAKQLEQQQQQQVHQILRLPTDNTTQQLNSLSLSTCTVAKPNHITLPARPTLTTNNKIAAVTNANAPGTGPVFSKKKRSWHKANVLSEMKALFTQEQERTQTHRQPTLDNSRMTCISTAEPKLATTATSSTIPITLFTPRKAHGNKEVPEVVLSQTPGYESEFLRRPRTHYNNFWRTCASTSAGDTTTDTNRSSSSSSSSEEELPFRFGRRRTITPAHASSASAFSSTTSTCLSETIGKSADCKRLLALRIRDTFLVPRGTSLLDQALSRAGSHLPDPFAPSLSSLQLEKSESASATCLELGTMKSLIRTRPPLSALPQPADKPGSAPITTAITPLAEQPKIDPIPSPPKAASATSPCNERVFIFVDNSNILHGFHQTRHQLEMQRAADGISVDATSSSNSHDNHYHHQQPRDLQHKHCSESLGLEDGMAQVTPTSTNDDGFKSFLPGTTATSNGPKVKMARGSHRFPKFNYSKFFDLLKRDRTAARQVLVGSSPLFQELDEAMEHQYETIILRRVKKFVQGELGAVPVPVKQLRFQSSFSNGGGSSSFCDGTESSAIDKSAIFTTTMTTSTTLPTTTAAAGSGSGSGSGGGGAQAEQGVDELLHLKMLETLLDHEPATIVLASGDGNDSEFGGGGFYAVIRRALDRGWHVEVVSWEDQLSGVYLDLALEYGYSCEHKLASTPDGGKRCHVPSPVTSFETVTVPDRPKKQKKQQECPPSGTRKQKRALALAQAQEKEKDMERERESKQRRCGHLRVWCLDWYGDILLQPTPSSRSE
ncbi:hypothetical protein BGZ96_001961 [Linnemannia gamsii]|uniref:NYN domain-containing protein n=1 Tax=Linnemannia gamsii TaxID=64522 RepID=A0ABQ7K8J6_9FUNG|nr:hypothetical protein BGZ96_001961 [Linnemannia gamsii]